MDLAARAVLIALLALTAACGPRTEQASAPTDSVTLATLYPVASAVVEQSPTATPVAIASATAAPTPSPRATTRPLAPTAPPSRTAPLPTTSPTPAQTRVPNSDALPTPHGLPASDGCLTYGAQPPYISFVDCVVHGLPPAAAVTLTANGEVVFLRIGSTVVFPDGTWYFPWSEYQHKEIVFVVTAGGVSRSITQVFK